MPSSTSVWSIEGLEDRFRDLVESGMLVDEGTMRERLEAILEILNDEFSDTFVQSEHRLSKQSLKDKLPSIIWTKDVEALIKTFVRHHRSVNDFLDRCPWIPKRIAARKYRDFGGAASSEPEMVKFRPGFGRISSAMEDTDLGEFDLPHTSFDSPLELDVEDGAVVIILNGVNLGIPHSGLIVDNPAREALAFAERKGSAAVVLTNFLDISTVKASGAHTVFRALTSGSNINPQSMVASYASKAQGILDERPVGSIVYQTVEETFHDSMRGWVKITTKPGGKPEFSGPVYIVLGRKEQDFIAAAAYWEAAYWTRRKQDDLEVDIKIEKAALAQNKSDNHAKLQEFQDERARTIISNVHPEEWQRYFKMALAFFVKNIEESIPNSRVIGMGTSFIRAGGKTIEFNIPAHVRVSDTLLGAYTGIYGPKVLRRQMPDIAVICHPYARSYRTTIRENDSEGVRGSSVVVVAPITVDEAYLRESFQDLVGAPTPIAKVVQSELFSAGLLQLEFVNGLVAPVNIPITALAPKQRSRKNSAAEPRYDSKYMWMMCATDPHFGSPTREMLEMGDGSYKGCSDAVMEMMRRAGLFENGSMPVHMFVVNDDPVQGHNVSYQKQPHHNKAPFSEIEKYMQKQRAAADKTSDVVELRAILGDTIHFATKQFLRRGEYWTQDQVMWFMNHFIEVNLDFYSAVLTRAEKAGIRIKGISAYKADSDDFPYDARDPGLINFGTGNHFAGGVDKEMTEGVLYAQLLRALLRTVSKWRNEQDLIEALVRAPLYGNIFVSYGVVQVGDGYLWGLDLRSAPPKMQGWEDPLRGWVNIDLRRGNYSLIQDIGMTLKVCGDKHFHGVVQTPYALYHMSPPDTPTDSFAEWAGGFPPNNTGVSFVGLPVDGPESGPIVVRSLLYDRIRDYFDGTNPDFDWEAFLPNPA